MRAILAPVMSLLLLISACGGGGEPLPAPDALSGAWQLTSGSFDGDPIDPIPDHPITIEFETGRVGGTAACNGYGGTFDLEGAAITLSDMSITEMACSPPDVMESEQLYIAALAAVDQVELSGGSLVLTGPAARLEFEALPPVPTADLLGTVWVLDGLIQGDAVSSVGGERATLELFTDGSFIASTGCRTLVGNYVEAEGGIATTSMTAQGECSEGLTAQDSMVITVLEGNYRASVDGRRLTLTTAGADGLTYIAEQ